MNIELSNPFLKGKTNSKRRFIRKHRNKDAKISSFWEIFINEVTIVIYDEVLFDIKIEKN